MTCSRCRVLSTLMRTSASGSTVDTSITELVTTELVTMENLFVFQEGRAWRDVLDGVYDADGRVPCRIDEAYLQFQHRAGARQLKDPKLALTPNRGGAPWSNACSVSPVGLH
jgi:acetyl-CoA C-acetyltransferase